ncbi:formimidoylglutamate deiminase [Affinibrenneria salicis]|uniref:Formimidoylglutamate deiminase n=1 Tax=Affinibrenneria salicis TaxID=2590031 RepID=A0A5J5FT68_9GAMM|nr:formimidoylglutamate deiminase [Affinibrenneria salicis]KAA8996641.1 formimidoylglutamate deiminase [Affinibrenneria salicis]
MTANQLFAQYALLNDGWRRDVLLEWNPEGLLSNVSTAASPPPGVARAGWLLPGMPNLHSHAFQRAFSGLTEYRQQREDSFWSWRNLMYAFAARISPEQMEIVATWLYSEMLEAGYTSVCEFHYVHHQSDGAPYAEPTTLCRSLLNAAKNTGIGLTLLPVCYQNSGFGGLPPESKQRRFINDSEQFLSLWQQLQAPCRQQQVRLGVAPHSLRAVTPASLTRLIDGVRRMDAHAPVHIHVAEQQKEVEDCLAWSGQRPVEWLMNNQPVDERWCLIHATHMTEPEYRRAAASGAVAGLCPSTEANLGDGIFDFPLWRRHGGRWGIGSDSHVAVSAAEELLLLEYSQRLQRRQRNICADDAQPDVAASLYLGALRGGAQACGRPVAGLAVGQRADMVELDGEHVALAQLPLDNILAGHLFGSSRASALRRVWTGGRLRVDRQHTLHSAAQAAFADVRRQLLQHL